jgi:hypothetical protein
VIANRLAVSERIGGTRVPASACSREEEINWLVREAGITARRDLVAGNQNLAAYEAAGLVTHTVPISGEPGQDRPAAALRDPRPPARRSRGRMLVHREIIDDTVGGLLGGYWWRRDS